MLSAQVQAKLPWHKSLIIRFAFEDLIHGMEQRSIEWLEDHYDELGDDLHALLRTFKQYLAGEDLDVGESDTLRVFWIKFLEHTSDKRQVITRGTLKLRDPADRQSSKWASINVLLGKRPPATDPHIALTYRACNEWEQATERGEMWPARKDDIITECIEAYAFYKRHWWLFWSKKRRMPLRLNNSEKGCQGVAFGLISWREMKRRWPKSVNHESNRPQAMRTARRRARLRKVFWWLKLKDDDHRVVMAMAMRGVPYEAFSNPMCVTKSCPFFWDILPLIP